MTVSVLTEHAYDHNDGGPYNYFMLVGEEKKIDVSVLFFIRSGSVGRSFAALYARMHILSYVCLHIGNLAGLIKVSQSVSQSVSRSVAGCCVS